MSLQPQPRYQRPNRQNPVRFFNQTDNTRDQVRQDRDFAYRGYEDLKGEGDDYYDRTQTEYDNSRDRSDAAYDDLNSRPGLTPEQRANLSQYDSELDGLQLGDSEYEAAHYNAGEREAITGDPRAARERNFRPEYENAVLNDMQGRRRTALDQTASDYQFSYDPDRLRSSDQYGDDVRGAVDEFGSSSGSAIDDYESSAGDAVSRDRLALDPAFRDRYRMSDSQKQRMVTAAGQDVGAAYKAEQDRTHRASAAAGIDPVGSSILAQRTMKQSTIGAADAMTRARIGADEAQADREKTIEGMRLDAERGYSDRAVRVAEGVADRKLSAADRLAGRKVDAYGDVESARMRGEETVAGLNTRRTEYLGNMKDRAETEMGRDQVDQARDHAVRGYDYDRDAENASAERAALLARDRVNNERYAQDQRYQRGMDRFGVRYGREQAGVNATREDQREARGYFTGQTNAARGERQSAMQTKVGIFNSGTAAAQGATGNAISEQRRKDAKPTFWDRLSTGLSNTARIAAGGA